MPRHPRRLRRGVAVAVARAVIGAATIGILIHTYVLGIPVRGANPFDYFGYFTNLTSLLTGLVLLATAGWAVTRRTIPLRLQVLRGVMVACMVIVGLVYNLIVPGTGSAPPWVSVALHIVLPLAVVADWTLVPDRPPLPWRHLWAVLPYPLVWLAVTLIRGATDGWVPYGFLLPERGTGALALTSGALLLTLLAAGAVVWGLSRVGARRV